MLRYVLNDDDDDSSPQPLTRRVVRFVGWLPRGFSVRSNIASMRLLSAALLPTKPGEPTSPESVVRSFTARQSKQPTEPRRPSVRPFTQEQEEVDTRHFLDYTTVRICGD